MENRAGCYLMGDPEFDQRVVGWVNSLRTQARDGRHSPQEIVALDHVLHDMRLYKSRVEIGLMREAARIAARAHVRAMQFCRPGLKEYEVMAEIIHEFRLHNADTSITPSSAVAPTAASCTIATTISPSKRAMCCWSTPVASMSPTLPTLRVPSGLRSLQGAARRVRGRARGPSGQRSRQCVQATTGTSRTRLRFASSRTDW